MTGRYAAREALTHHAVHACESPRSSQAWKGMLV